MNHNIIISYSESKFSYPFIPEDEFLASEKETNETLFDSSFESPINLEEGLILNDLTVSSLDEFAARKLSFELEFQEILELIAKGKDDSLILSRIANADKEAFLQNFDFSYYLKIIYEQSKATKKVKKFALKRLLIHYSAQNKFDEIFYLDITFLFHSIDPRDYQLFSLIQIAKLNLNQNNEKDLENLIAYLASLSQASFYYEKLLSYFFNKQKIDKTLILAQKIFQKDSKAYTIASNYIALCKSQKEKNEMSVNEESFFNQTLALKHFMDNGFTHIAQGKSRANYEYENIKVLIDNNACENEILEAITTALNEKDFEPHFIEVIKYMYEKRKFSYLMINPKLKPFYLYSFFYYQILAKIKLSQLKSINLENSNFIFKASFFKAQRNYRELAKLALSLISKKQNKEILEFCYAALTESLCFFGRFSEAYHLIYSCYKNDYLFNYEVFFLLLIYRKQKMKILDEEFTKLFQFISSKFKENSFQIKLKQEIDEPSKKIFTPILNDNAIEQLTYLIYLQQFKGLKQSITFTNSIFFENPKNPLYVTFLANVQTKTAQKTLNLLEESLQANEDPRILFYFASPILRNLCLTSDEKPRALACLIKFFLMGLHLDLMDKKTDLELEKNLNMIVEFGFEFLFSKQHKRNVIVSNHPANPYFHYQYENFSWNRKAYLKDLFSICKKLIKNGFFYQALLLLPKNSFLKNFRTEAKISGHLKKAAQKGISSYLKSAKCHYKAGNFEEAIQSYSLFFEAKGQFEAIDFYQYAYARIQKGLVNKSVFNDLLKAINLDPEFNSAYQLIFFHFGEMLAANNFSFLPKNLVSFYFIANFYFLKRNFLEAYKWCESYEKLYHPAETKMDLLFKFSALYAIAACEIGEDTRLSITNFTIANPLNFFVALHRAINKIKPFEILEITQGYKSIYGENTNVNYFLIIAEALCNFFLGNTKDSYELSKNSFNVEWHQDTLALIALANHDFYAVSNYFKYFPEKHPIIDIISLWNALLEKDCSKEEKISLASKYKLIVSDKTLPASYQISFVLFLSEAKLAEFIKEFFISYDKNQITFPEDIFFILKAKNQQLLSNFEEISKIEKISKKRKSETQLEKTPKLGKIETFPFYEVLKGHFLMREYLSAKRKSNFPIILKATNDTRLEDNILINLLMYEKKPVLYVIANFKVEKKKEAFKKIILEKKKEILSDLFKKLETRIKLNFMTSAYEKMQTLMHLVHELETKEPNLQSYLLELKEKLKPHCTNINFEEKDKPLKINSKIKFLLKPQKIFFAETITEENASKFSAIINAPIKLFKNINQKTPLLIESVVSNKWIAILKFMAKRGFIDLTEKTFYLFLADLKKAIALVKNNQDGSKKLLITHFITAIRYLFSIKESVMTLDESCLMEQLVCGNDIDDLKLWELFQSFLKEMTSEAIAFNFNEFKKYESALNQLKSILAPFAKEYPFPNENKTFSYLPLPYENKLSVEERIKSKTVLWPEMAWKTEFAQSYSWNRVGPHFAHLKASENEIRLFEIKQNYEELFAFLRQMELQIEHSDSLFNFKTVISIRQELEKLQEKLDECYLSVLHEKKERLQTNQLEPCEETQISIFDTLYECLHFPIKKEQLIKLKAFLSSLFRDCPIQFAEQKIVIPTVSFSKPTVLEKFYTLLLTELNKFIEEETRPDLIKEFSYISDLAKKYTE